MYFKNNISSLENLNSDKFDDTNKSNSYIAIINNINERKSKNGKRFCFLTLSDDTTSLDAICFSEILDNLDFTLKNGEVYIFKISKQFMKDSFGFVINGIKMIDKYDNNSSYEISMISDKLNHEKFKTLLQKHLNGKNKIQFTMISDDKKILIESNERYDVNLDFMNEIRLISGVLAVEKIN